MKIDTGSLVLFLSLRSHRATNPDPNFFSTSGAICTKVAAGGHSGLRMLTFSPLN